MNRSLIIFAISGFVSFAAVSAENDKPSIPTGLNIAAVVGDEAISSYDVDARMRFVMSTTKLSNNEETIARIRPQVIRSLIDERLELKEAENNKITISDDEITKAIAAIEAQRNMPAGAIIKILKQGHVPQDTFTNQIKSQLAWNKLLIKKIRPTIKISDEEAALAQKKLSIPQVLQELEIALLTIPIDKPKREGEVRALAEKLSKEMHEGASFEELSRQFSSSSANAGGKVETFWVRPEQLDPSVGKELSVAKAGMITRPLRTPDGYTIVKVYNTRSIEGGQQKETEYRLKDILLKLKRDAENKEAEVLLTIGEEVARNPGSCAEKGIAGVNDLKDFDIEVNIYDKRQSELNPAVRTILEHLKVGEISAPFASEQGIQLYMLCERKEQAPATLDIDRVKNVIFQQKMELEAQKYLRNLRRDTYIEVRK